MDTLRKNTEQFSGKGRREKEPESTCKIAPGQRTETHNWLHNHTTAKVGEPGQDFHSTHVQGKETEKHMGKGNIHLQRWERRFKIQKKKATHTPLIEEEHNTQPSKPGPLDDSGAFLPP